MKVLNLDVLAKVKRTFTLNGKQYEVKEMSVNTFIETTLAAEKMEKSEDGKNASITDQIKDVVALIRRFVPTCPEDELGELSLDNLFLLSSFVRGLDDGNEGVEGAEGTESAEGDKKKTQETTP